MEIYLRHRALAWFIIIIAAVFYAYEYLLRIYPALMTQELAQYFAIMAIQVGHLAACYYYAYAIMQIPVGVLLDRYSPFKILLLACLACVAGTISFILADNFLLAQISRFIVGFGSAFAFVGTLKLATLWLPKRYFVFAAGLTSTLGLLAAMGGNILLAMAIQQHGWQATLWGLAYLGMLLLGVLLVTALAGAEPAIPATTIVKLHVNFNYAKQLLRNPLLWLNGLAGCLFYLPLSVFAELWGVAYLEQTYQLSNVTAATAVANIFLGWAIGAPFIGILTSRFLSGRLILMLGSWLTAGLFSILLAAKTLSLFEIKLILFLIGLFNSSQIIILETACKLNPIEYSGTSLAMTNMLVMLGGAILQPAVGWLLDLQGFHFTHHGGIMLSPAVFQNALLVIPIACLVVGWLSYLIKVPVTRTSTS